MLQVLVADLSIAALETVEDGIEELAFEMEEIILDESII